MKKTETELLAPAGNLKSLRYALAYGADAVYAGHPRYSLRARNNDFDMENLQKAIEYTHEQEKKLYITSNIFPHNNKVKTYTEHMAEMAAMRPDAFIMADPGLIMIAKESWPEIPIHLSVQANTINYAAVNFWKSVGVSRIILSRELTLDEIKKIREECPDIELEVFIHGALCISYSGRCLLSGYFNKRDANQGTCSNSCRWKYRIYEDNSDLNKIDLAIEEQERKGIYMPISEDEHGTYILNSKDLRAIRYINDLYKAGINSVKIEGRTKSHYYVARAVKTYREALNDAATGNPFNEKLLEELDGLSNREYTEGFFRKCNPAETQNYETGNSISKKQRFIGEILDYNNNGTEITVDVKNRFSVGDNVQLIATNGDIHFTIESITDGDNNSIDAAPGSGYIVKLTLPQNGLALTNALLVKNLL
ncbi:MAG: U32 family peptidase [Gammaproteobacteria bacterium]|nr:MAG: U32 family peptidase [Gammaproteobacteria bacterium]